jgi:hypothetical protein
MIIRQLIVHLLAIVQNKYNPGFGPNAGVQKKLEKHVNRKPRNRLQG